MRPTEKLEAENQELAGWVKEITTALSDAIGLGSEMFRRHGEEYRIDPKFVSQYIRERRQAYFEMMAKNAKLIKSKAASEGAEFEALRDAFIRGASWRDANGTLELAHKAACDFADYETSPITKAERATDEVGI